ncbi:MAG: LemA family protein [Bacteroidia bacterium]
MKRTWIIVLVVLGIIFLGGCSSYNGLNEKFNEVDGKWADLQADYQRRLNLIPNIVKTVKGYAEFEKSTLTAVIEARAKATSINISAENLDDAAIAKINAQMSQVSGALNKLLAIAENYPNLKANEGFLKLQDQLEGTENRITTSRKYYNEAVKIYNTSRRRFPTIIFASILGFKVKPYFEAEAGAEKGVDVGEF